MTSVHHRREAQAARADAELFETEFLHHRLVNQDAGQNHVRAQFRQAGDFLALGQRQAPQMFPVGRDLFAAQNRAFDSFAVKAVQFFLDAREDARRAARADQLNFAGRGTGLCLAAQGRFKLRTDFDVAENFSPNRGRR